MSADQLNTNGGSNAAAPQQQQQQPNDAATVLQQQTLNLDARLQQVEAALAQAQQAASSSAAQAAAAQQQLAAFQAGQAATSTSSATPAVERLKIPEPERYRGSQDRVPVREWVDSIKERFNIGNVSLNTIYAVTYAGAYLINEAKIWFRMYQNDTTTTWHNFQEFEAAIIDRFRDRREEEKARIRLDNVRQTSTVDAYNIAFDKAVMYLENITGTRRDEHDLIHIYKNGLNNNIKVILAVKDTNRLDEMKRTALEVDAAMRNTSTRPFNVSSNNKSSNNNYTQYNKPNVSKSTSSRPSYNTYKNNNSNYNRSFNKYPPNNYNSTWRTSSSNTGYAPMDIDNPSTRTINQNGNKGGYKS